MNAIQIKDRIDFYNDLTRVSRFPLEDYVKAVNDAVILFTDQIIGDVKDRQPYGFQSIQQIRSRLNTLIKKATPTITTLGTVTTSAGSFTENHIVFPTDYYDFVAAWPLIDAVTSYCRPLNYDQRGPILENTFKKPANTKVYYNEDDTGLILTRGTTGTFTSVTLEYIKTPAVYSLGATSNYITAGNLTVATYIACEETVFAGVTYTSGTEFVGAVSALTSGRVILKSLTTTIDLPTKVHESIAKIASSIMLGVIGMVQSAAIVNNEVNKNN